MKRASPHAAAAAAFRLVLQALARPLDTVFAALERADALAELANLSLPLADVDPLAQMTTSEAVRASESQAPASARGRRAPTVSATEEYARGRRAPLPVAKPPAPARVTQPSSLQTAHRRVNEPDGRSNSSRTTGSGRFMETYAGGDSAVNSREVGSGQSERAGALRDALQRAFFEPDERLPPSGPLSAPRRTATSPGVGSISASMPAAAAGVNAQQATGPQLGAESSVGSASPTVPAAATPGSRAPVAGTNGDLSREGLLTKQADLPDSKASIGRRDSEQRPAEVVMAGAAATLAYYNGKLFARKPARAGGSPMMTAAAEQPRSPLPPDSLRPAVSRHRVPGVPPQEPAAWGGAAPLTSSDPTERGSSPSSWDTTKRGALPAAGPVATQREGSPVSGRLAFDRRMARSGLLQEQGNETCPKAATGQRFGAETRRPAGAVPFEPSMDSWQEGRRLADLINEVLAEQARLDGVDLS